MEKKHLIPLLILAFIFISCKENKVDSKSSNDYEYINYLKQYQEEALENEMREIKFEKIGDTIYWVTYYHGAGTRQEYFWINNENKLIPKYIFEYGGMNWDEPINYTLISLDKKDTLTGVALEKDILLKKK